MRVYVEKLRKYELPPFQFHTQNRYSIPQNGCFVFTVYLQVSILSDYATDLD